MERLCHVALVMLLVACKRRGAGIAALDASPPRPASSSTAAPTVSVVDRLRRHAVTDADHARRVLYTWTPIAQIAALRVEGARLLTATAYEGSGPSRFVLDLEDRMRAKKTDHEIDRLVLLHPSLARRRYAWPSPFATRMGLAGRGYGDALIRVELAEGAVIARFEPEAAVAWSFVDTSGTSVDRAAVVADPERIAAVFHVRRARTATAPFREYVLINEKRIAGWSFGTEAIAREVKEEVALLRALSTAFASAPPAGVWSTHWAKLELSPSLEATWSATLAFDNERYAPSAENVTAIANALERWDPTPPPLVRP